jgi:predicted nucleic acid-binding protein
VAHPLPSDEIARLIEDYLSWEIVVNTPQAIVAALAIEARYKISYWDALILHAAESCGAAVVYSEDMSHGQRYGAVEVVNPLRG